VTALLVVYAGIALAVLAQGLLEEVVGGSRVRRHHLGWHLAVAACWGPGVVIALTTMLKDYLRARGLTDS
jgi:hypothetical protein